MDPPLSGLVLDPAKCSKMSIVEKRELIRELSKWPENALEKLQAWTRRDLLEILCAELGKERKYTSLTKQKIVEYLFRVVADKKSGERAKDMDSTPVPSTPSPQTPAKRQRKNEHPSRLPIIPNNLQMLDVEEAPDNLRYCQNLACRATLNVEDAFCKRCSCRICLKYDDNKDPSLWLVCGSETHPGESCGMSFHLECALKHERAGMMNSENCTKLDGGYYCIHCGKANDSLGCWRKQLTFAKYARRVDALCYRISLGHKLLSSTEKYKSLHEIVDTARKTLEAEVGPIDDLSDMARGIVNRLSVGTEVQKLCASAVDLLDSIRSDARSTHTKDLLGSLSSSIVKFEEVSATSLTVAFNLENVTPIAQELAGLNLWQRPANTPEYPKEPSFSLSSTRKSLLITELAPATEYTFKAVAFSNTRELGTWEVGVKTQGISVDKSMGLSMEEAVVTKPQCHSPKTTSSGLSDPSEGDESNTNSTACADLNKLPEIDFDDCEKPEILEAGKSTDDAEKDTTKQNNGCKGNGGGTEAIEPETAAAGNSESALDEEPNSTIQTDSTNSTENNQASDIPKSENESNNPVANEMATAPFGQLDSTLPGTPCRMETGTEGFGRCSKGKSTVDIFENGSMKPDREPGSSSKKRCGGKFDGLNADGHLEGAYEYCVKVIRWLECEGFIETSFRVKFLTWFSLRATPQERRVVRVYVDTLIDDPPSLAGQLVDTFSEAISSKRPPPVPNGFCMKLWH